jgi:putative tryptophan/tyrosine transport system substrate-binding protein
MRLRRGAEAKVRTPCSGASELAGVGLVFVLPDPLFVAERRRIAALAIEAHLPTLFALREHVQAGGLLSYGIDVSEGFRRVASFLDKILKGGQAG